MAKQAFVKAKIALKDSGPLSHEGRGRRLKRGEVHTITSVEDIRYYMGTGLHDVTIVQGAFPGMAVVEPEPAPEPPDSEPEPEAEPASEPEPEPEPEHQEPTEEQAEGEGEGEGEPEAEGEPEDTNAADADGEAEGEPEAEPEGEAPVLVAYVRSELEALSKNKLIAKAAEDGLDVKLDAKMAKPAIIDAMMAANPANQA